MNVIAWKAWYTGGRAYCSTGKDFTELPDDGCLGFVLLLDKFSADTQHRRIMHGANWYFFYDGDGGPIYGHSDEPDISERFPGAVIVRGKWTNETEMDRVLDAMKVWHG